MALGGRSRDVPPEHLEGSLHRFDLALRACDDLVGVDVCTHVGGGDEHTSDGEERCREEWVWECVREKGREGGVKISSRKVARAF